MCWRSEGGNSFVELVGDRGGEVVFGSDGELGEDMGVRNEVGVGVGKVGEGIVVRGGRWVERMWNVLESVGKG